MSAPSAAARAGAGVSFLETLRAVDAELAVSGALLRAHRSLRARSGDMIARSHRLLASSPVFWLMPRCREDARIVENARASELRAVIERATSRCSHSGCGTAPRYRVHVIAEVGENEVVIESLGLRVCALHRAELTAILGDSRILRLFREKLEARKGAAVPVHALRAVFRAEGRWPDA